MRPEISAEVIARILGASSPKQRDDRACCLAARRAGRASVPLVSVGVEELQRIYRIRAANNGPERPRRVQRAIDNLLVSLEAHEGVTVKMAVIIRRAYVYAILLDQDESELVACMVLRDRRELPSVAGQA